MRETGRLRLRERSRREEKGCRHYLLPVHPYHPRTEIPTYAHFTPLRSLSREYSSIPPTTHLTSHRHHPSTPPSSRDDPTLIYHPSPPAWRLLPLPTPRKEPSCLPCQPHRESQPRVVGSSQQHHNNLRRRGTTVIWSSKSLPANNCWWVEPHRASRDHITRVERDITTSRPQRHTRTSTHTAHFHSLPVTYDLTKEK